MNKKDKEDILRYSKEQRYDLNRIETRHKKTYIEYEIPSDLEDELDNIIEEKIREYQKKCTCDQCIYIRKWYNDQEEDEEYTPV